MGKQLQLGKACLHVMLFILVIVLVLIGWALYGGLPDALMLLR